MLLSSWYVFLYRKTGIIGIAWSKEGGTIMFKKKKAKHSPELEEFNAEEAIKGKSSYFTDQAFKDKLGKYAKKLGIKISYYSLLLFYAFKSPATSKKDKLTIAGALGYLILPVDAIPDFIPVAGLTDDASVILYAVYRVISSIDDEVKERADQKMKKLFGVHYLAKTEDIDSKLNPTT